MPNASTDTEQCVASVLTRLQLAVTAHQARIVKVLAPGEALERRERDSEHRTPAVSPGTAHTSVPSELRALCSYFGIDVEIDTAGGHAVLREARRVCEQVRTAPTAAGPRADGEQLRRWHWLTAVTLVPKVPSWQQAQHAALAKLELTSAPMIAAMSAACTLGNVVRESGVVAAAAVDTDGSALSETAHAAAHLLQASRAHELHCELRQCLNVLRSVQRTLALRAAGWLPPPLPDGSRLDPEAIASGGLPSSAARAARSARVQLPDASAAIAAAPSAAAAIGGVSEGGGAEIGDAGVEIATALTLATCPILPPLRPAPLPTTAVSRRLVVSGGREWFSYEPTAPATAHAAGAGVGGAGAAGGAIEEGSLIVEGGDPTNSIFVRDGSGARVVHLTALSDLQSLTAELGRVCSHYGNDSAMAAVYGTGKYDANSVVESKKLRGAEAEAEVAKRLAVAKALPSALRLVSRCFGCEVAFQRAKVSATRVRPSLLLHPHAGCRSLAGSSARCPRLRPPLRTLRMTILNSNEQSCAESKGTSSPFDVRTRCCLTRGRHAAARVLPARALPVLCPCSSPPSSWACSSPPPDTNCACAFGCVRQAALVLSHLEAYEACTDPTVATALAQRMTDVMAARPRLDLSASSFEAGYSASTLALQLETALLSRLLAAHIDETLLASAAAATAAATFDAPAMAPAAERGGASSASAGAAAGAAPSASFAPVLAPSVEERRAAAAGCAAVALALHDTVSGLEDQILDKAAKAYGVLGAAHVTPHTHVGRLRCLLLSQGLVIAEPLALPPPLAPKTEPMADEAVREAAMARKMLKKEPVAPWVEAAAVAAVVEQRAYMRSKEGDKEGAGAGDSSLDVPPICAHELRKRPALLPTLGVWSAVVRTSHELIELREAVRRAKPRLAWVPWLSLLPRLATNAPASDDTANGGGRPGSSPPPPTRKLVPGAERFRQSDESLATAKVFLAAVAKDGAAVVRTKGSEAAARCVLQLLEAERHALMLVLLRQRPPHLPSRFPLPPVGGDASDVQLVERSLLASVTLTREADDACRKLERAMAEAPPQYLQQLSSGGGGGGGGGGGLGGGTGRGDAAAHHRVLVAHAEAQLSSALVENAAQIELVQAEAAAQSIVHGGDSTDEEAALRAALSTARLGLHASEEGGRAAMERELAELSDDLQAEIAEIEERLEEVLAVDLTEAKEQALKTAQAYERQWETAAHDLQPAADKLAEQQNFGGVASPSKFPPPNKAKVAQNRLEAEADVNRQLDELRLVISMRKLREHAAESIHARRLEELHNGTSLAIAASLDKPRETSLGTYDDGPQEDELALRSVAEVLEAERQLSDELRATQKANASLLDKLDSLKAASKATDQEHTTFLHGKVRHLLKQHMGVGGEKPPETRWR